MAEPLSDRGRLEWFKRHHFLPEAAWAAEFSHLVREERLALRVRLLDPEYKMPKVWGTAGGEMRQRFLLALQTLDLLDESPPDTAARRAAATLLERVSKGGAGG